MERYEIVADDEGRYCGLIPSENGSVVKYADAQATVEALQREGDTLREATKVICGHCCEPMAIPSKAILQSQLSALQGLVRVYFTEPDPHKWTAAYQTLKRMGRALPATPTERGQDEK